MKPLSLLLAFITVTVICKTMSKDYSESLGFGWPNEFWECRNEKTGERRWTLYKPEFLNVKVKFEK